MSAAIKCDNCGIYADHEMSFGFDGLYVPERWVELKFVVGDDRGLVRSSQRWDGGSFCRLECAAAFMAKRAAAARSAASRDESEEA